MTIWQFGRALNDGSELVVNANGWPGYHCNCEIFEVPRLNPECTIEYYDYDLCMYYKANWEKAFFVCRLTDQYLGIKLSCFPLFVHFLYVLSFIRLL